MKFASRADIYLYRDWTNYEYAHTKIIRTVAVVVLTSNHCQKSSPYSQDRLTLNWKNTSGKNKTKQSSYASWGHFLCSWICSPLKKYLSVRHELFPRRCWKEVFLASEYVGVFSKLYPGLFPASPGPQLQEITVTPSTFFYPTGSKIRLQSPIGSEKAFFSIRSGILLIFDSAGSNKCRTSFFRSDPGL